MTQTAQQLQQTLPSLWGLLSDSSLTGSQRTALLSVEALAAYCSLFASDAAPPLERVLSAAAIEFQKEQQETQYVLLDEPDSPVRRKHRTQKPRKRHKHKRQRVDALDESSEAGRFEQCVWTISSAGSEFKMLTKELQQALIRHMFCRWSNINN